jgi:hypothetical protein
MISDRNLHASVSLTALVLGGLVILSTVAVFLLHGTLDVFGIGFGFIGLVMMSLSFWQSVGIKIAGAEIKLEQAQRLVETAQHVREAVVPVIEKTKPVIEQLAVNAYTNLLRSQDEKQPTAIESNARLNKADFEKANKAGVETMRLWATKHGEKYEEKSPAQLAQEVQQLIQQWRAITDMTSGLSKDINDLAMMPVRNLR